MKIALAQMSMTDKVDHNLSKSLDLIKEASKKGANLILFPELQLTKFFPQYKMLDKDDLAISTDSKILDLFKEAARKNNIIVIPNLYIKDKNSYYDTSFVIDRTGDILGSQKMVHVANFPQFHETDYYDSSKEGFKVIETDIGRIGIVVCFDRHFPESIRTLTLKGANFILIPTANIVNEPEELFKWEIAVQAFQNEIPVIMCNRTGKEDKMEFSGHSIVVNDSGEIVFYADNNEELIIVDLEITNKNKNYIPLRKKEFYL